MNIVGFFSFYLQHLKSDKHSTFTAKANEHFASVDQVIATLPNLATVIASAQEKQNFQYQLKAKNRLRSVEYVAFCY